MGYMRRLARFGTICTIQKNGKIPTEDSKSINPPWIFFLKLYKGTELAKVSHISHFSKILAIIIIPRNLSIMAIICTCSENADWL